VPEKFEYHLELWDKDGTILFDHDGTEPFPDWQNGETVTDERVLKKPFVVQRILDSSNEKDGTVYFRRMVRVRIVG
jgi:hypothetical protein